MTTAFATLGLGTGLVQTVTALGYTQPTPIQARAIPELLAGRDVLGQAQTGTGKTAAFALPMLQRLNLRGAGVRGLGLAPPRELAIRGGGRKESGAGPNARLGEPGGGCHLSLWAPSGGSGSASLWRAGIRAPTA